MGEEGGEGEEERRGGGHQLTRKQLVIFEVYPPPPPPPLPSFLILAVRRRLCADQAERERERKERMRRQRVKVVELNGIIILLPLSILRQLFWHKLPLRGEGRCDSCDYDSWQLLSCLEVHSDKHNNNKIL